MFIAHAPSGYIMAISLINRAKNISVSAIAVITVGMFGAIAPDLDILYFYLVDNRQTNHRKYITHWPILWLTTLVISIAWLYLSKNKKSPFLILIFSLGGLLHVILDSLAGGILWFSPFIDKPYALVVIPAAFKPWWLSFILHWTFVVELGICILSLFICRQRSNKSIQPTR
ncbi:MAG: metal-dependent hydrolase [Phycisphaerales bacterium]|nr:metal-dependent hydrolase [Phycisphaerales bacterium]